MKTNPTGVGRSADRVDRFIDSIDTRYRRRINQVKSNQLWLIIQSK